MLQNSEMLALRHRLVLSSLGAIGAVALWALADNWTDPFLSPPLYLAVFTFIAIFFSVTLALAGPIRSDKALAGALLIAVPVTVLVSLAGLRQVVATDLLDDPVMLSVIAVLVFCSTPFLLVRLRSPADWRSYAALFDAAWAMLVRYVLAYIFVGVFWLIAFLSNALLELVGVNFIERLIETDWAIFALSGAVLGLGLAVVFELREKISPFLILRLLRLLVPVVLLVMVVFLAAIPFRGLGEVFGEFSAAATLMGAAIVAITLISTAVDRDDAHAVQTRGLSMATRALAVLLSPLCALAGWAMLLRIEQYGWTPDRILAIAAALFGLAYALSYSVAVLRGSNWRAQVRNVNVAMALMILVVSALWLTPVLNPLRISANSQVARFESGKSNLDQLSLWTLQHDWGKAGQKALLRIEGLTGRADQAELQARLDAVRAGTSKYQFEKEVEAQNFSEERQNIVRLMAELMAVVPKDSAEAGLTLDDIGDLPNYQIELWRSGCNLNLPDGRPGCVLIRGTFSPGAKAGTQGMVLFLQKSDQARASFVYLNIDGNIVANNLYDKTSGLPVVLSPKALQRALDGAFEIRPSGANALYLDGWIMDPGTIFRAIPEQESN